MLDQEFWTEYTKRQPETDAADRLREILQPWLPNISSVLEVGCNRGDNLPAFDCMKRGVEPNADARQEAHNRGYLVRNATADNLPYSDHSFDLVFTAGVLIHLDRELLYKSLVEIHRVSRRYILAVEYDAPWELPVDYRGVRAGIYKRPYGERYLIWFPHLKLVGSGDAGEAFDGCKWWMLEKSGQ